MPINSPEIHIRMGAHSEKRYLEKTFKFFDGAIVASNLVEATPGATLSLLVRLAAKKADGRFLIDPMTYAFGGYKFPAGQSNNVDLSWLKSERKIKGKVVGVDFKKSYAGLAERFGKVFSAAKASSKGIRPSDFSSDADLQEMCERVVNYQMGRLKEEYEKDPAYKTFVEKLPSPWALLSPYFYIEATDTDAWLALAERIAIACNSLGSSVPVHGVLCFDKAFLDVPARMEKLLEIGRRYPAVWLWISGFSEEKATPSQLAAYKSFVQVLSSKAKVYSLHSGFFGLAMSKFGLSGISHSVGYGEQKEVVPIIGKSIPTVRFYVKDIKTKQGVPEVIRYFNTLGVTSAETFFEKVCNCVVCKGILSEGLESFGQFGELYIPEGSNRQSQAPSAAKKARFHFLMCRIKEKTEVGSADLNQVIQALVAAKAKWAGASDLGISSGHLDRWIAVLGS